LFCAVKGILSSTYSSIGVAGGNPAVRTSAFLTVCTVTPVLIPPSSPEKLHTRRCEKHLLAKGEIIGENGRSILAKHSDSHVIAEFFIMPQICEMGQKALLPLRRMAC
jgi:hypothetical protein